MAQLEEAAGDASNPADANPATSFEDIAADMLGEDDEEEQPAENDGEADEAEPEDEPELDETDDEPDLPAIDPPISWTAEEKGEFAKLPREVQETLTKREAQREKFVQSKAQEAAQARDAARSEALQFAEQLKAEAVTRLTQYAQQFEVNPPDARLFAQNPEAYAQQLEAYQYANAQRQRAQRDADQAKAEQAQYQSALQAHEQQLFRQRLEAELPEAFGESGQQFINKLAATAEALGYDNNAISNSSVEELKALKQVAEWQADAIKYRKAVSKQMERVRAGKGKTLPPVSRPGVSRGPQEGRKAKAESSWQAAVSAKTRSAREGHLAEWAEKSGWLD